MDARAAANDYGDRHQIHRAAEISLRGNGAQVLRAVRIMTARSAAARTLGTGSCWSPATAVKASSTAWRAITLAAISRTRHASSVAAWIMAGVARSSHA